MSETELGPVLRPSLSSCGGRACRGGTGKAPTITFAEEDEGHEEIVRSVEKYLEEESVFQFIEEALKLQRIYGGAGIFMVCDDGLEPDQPMDISRVRRIVIWFRCQT